MIKVLVIGEKTSQVKKFAQTLCSSYNSTKQGRMVYSYTGSWTNSKEKQFELTFLPLAGHISTIDTPTGFGWQECPPIEIVQNDNALRVVYQPKYVKILRKIVQDKDQIWLATDPDAEGDNIAYEALCVLEPILEKKNIEIKRIWNSSLTTREIKRSFEFPKSWSDKLALAVQGRKMADVWLGFAGTREVTLAARKVTRVKVLSVGRVQLPTLCMVVQRDHEIESFVPESRFNVKALLKTDNNEQFKVKHVNSPFTVKKEAEQITTKLEKTTKAQLNKLNKRVQHRKPPVPLNTTNAVSIITKIMKTSAEKALKLMEELYQAGLLSYPRTENRCFKDKFPHKDILSTLNQHADYVKFISTIKDMKQVRVNGPKKEEEEDHDPIHPTEYNATELNKLTADQFQVWDILARYYIGLFMNDQLIDRMTVVVDIKGEKFRANGKTISQAGWTEIMYWRRERKNELPSNLKEQQQLDIEKLYLKEYQTRPRPRWTDSELILAMERAKIGTKSSRPAIIKKLEQRKYITRKKRKLKSTQWGRTLITTLEPIWPEIVSPQFTAHVEDLMDQVAKQQRSFDAMIEKLRTEYLELHKQLQNKLTDFQQLIRKQNLSMSRPPSKKTYSKRKKATPQKKVASNKESCPKCKTGYKVKRLNRRTNSSFLGCSNYPSCKWTAPINLDKKEKSSQ